MMAFGGRLALLAALQYHTVNGAIARGDVKANYGLIIFVTVAILILAGLTIAYMIVTSDQL